ncbi:hypothetical protein CCACVL1_28057 [Corchorus capsularis]|uniref:Uncharacterized protein n=1 Tax=Corchorus capsularis TaxID=210143 RepID=A0A1R3G7U6_COCAP|nr:hypothetical protein CCACVL1_28057 [Corchorus capsularis]
MDGNVSGSERDPSKVGVLNEKTQKRAANKFYDRAHHVGDGGC